MDLCQYKMDKLRDFLREPILFSLGSTLVNIAKITKIKFDMGVQIQLNTIFLKKERREEEREVKEGRKEGNWLLELNY